jgi:hypothetical protein
MKNTFILILAFSFLGTVLFAQTNAPGTFERAKSPVVYQAPQQNPDGCSNILIYSDDPYNNPDRSLVALQNLGYSYTGYLDDDFAGFTSALTTGTWDLVIFADDNYTPPAGTYAALLAYVQGGGRLFYHSWRRDVALETALEVAVMSSYSANIPVYRWNASHPIFNIPNTVPDLTALEAIYYGVYGYKVNPTGSGVGVAGYVGVPTPNEFGLVIGNGGNTIYQGWMDANFADADTDGKNDQVELYENMILGLCTGGFEEVPVSNWALVLGFVLIVLAVALRFTKIARA